MMHFRWLTVLPALLASLHVHVVASVSAQGQPRTFHVDADRGDDARDGRTPATAWRSLAQVNRAPIAPGDRVLFCRGQTWRGQLIPRSGTAGGVVLYGAFGEGPKPVLLGSVAANRAEDWHTAGDGIWAARGQSVDVGNIIFDHGKTTGVKKWSAAELRRDGDFFYDAATSEVKLRSDGNPALRHASIELALRRHIIDQGGRGYVTYENLDLRYGAAHGIGGGSTHHITVRGCDLSYIGGGHQMTRPDGNPVRYGNGIEFWSGARDCLVEDCRLWEIYDAALTNQGDGTNVQENITYRRNVIWNCEYSFEYWNRGAASRTRRIVFENNTCVDAGLGWGHSQRPDPNGRHLMFYDNSAATTNVVIRSNLFCHATEGLLRLHGRDWTAALTMDGNGWYQPRGAALLWGQQTIGANECAAFLQARGFDRHSLFTDPQFVNAAWRDYRPAPESPAHGLGANRVPILGPVFERRLRTSYIAAEDRVLNLDDGRVFSVPTNWVVLNNPRPMLNWMVRQGADLMVNEAGADLRLHLDDGRLWRVADRSTLDTVTPAVLERVMAMAGGAQSLDVPGAGAVLAFQTREGGRGVLQLLESARAPRGYAQVRYRMVEP